MYEAFKKTFSKDHLDLVLLTSKDHETRIVEFPGRWMTQDELQELREALISVASKTLARGSLTYGVFKADGSGLRDTVITLIRDRSSGQPIAFNALAVMEVAHGSATATVLHLGLVMVDPGQRSRGLSWVLYGLTCLLFLLRNQLRPFWISNVTQVPAIVGMVAETFSAVYPQPDDRSRRSIEHLLLAREIMANHRHVFGVGAEAEFDEARFVIGNAYTGGSEDLKKSFDVAQKHRDEKYNSFCKDSLDYERGDDFLQIGRMDILASKDYLMKSVPRRSVLVVGAAAFFISLQRVLLPIIYWFDTSRPWRRLRARNT